MKTDLQILKQLEEKVGKKFIQLSLDKITKGGINGYSIGENENITGLNLSFLRIPDYSFLKELKNLTTLDLWNNQISDISFLKELKNLTWLNIGNNQISDISFLKELKNLTTLDLSSNQISEIPTEITQLKYLRSLNLRQNK